MIKRILLAFAIVALVALAMWSAAPVSGVAAIVIGAIILAILIPPYILNDDLWKN